MKSRWLRAVKNHCKPSKIHSSGDMRPGHGKGKVRKTDECIRRNCLVILNDETLVNGVRMLFTRVF